MERDEHSHIPRWNGDPPGFKRWSQEVKIYRMRKDLNKEISYAAELIVGLTGAARSAALLLSEEDLWPQYTLMTQAQDEVDLMEHPDPTEGEEQRPAERPAPRWVTNKEVNLMGIETLVKRLEKDLLQSKPVQRGERMEMFFGTNKYQRRRGMRMTEYNLLWQKGLDELREVNIDLFKLEDVAGWFYLKGAGLSNEQRERVLSVLPDEHYPLDALKSIMVRFFPGIHLRESTVKETPKWTKPQPSKGRGKFTPRAHQTNVAEVDEDEEQYEEEDAEEQNDIAEVLKAEVAGLMEELQAQGESAESLWEPEDASRVEDACAALAEASEALQTVRDAKDALRRRGSPSKGKPGGKGTGKTN